jgi:hypothetical protein
MLSLITIFPKALTHILPVIPSFSSQFAITAMP